MVTKMANKTGLKKRDYHFGPNLSLLETDFLRIRYQHKRIPRKTFSILCAFSDFIAFLGIQPVPVDFGKNPNKILRLGKKSPNWENTGLFWIGKQLFDCKIGKIKSLAVLILIIC